MNDATENSNVIVKLSPNSGNRTAIFTQKIVMTFLIVDGSDSSLTVSSCLDNMTAKSGAWFYNILGARWRYNSLTYKNAF